MNNKVSPHRKRRRKGERRGKRKGGEIGKERQKVIMGCEKVACGGGREKKRGERKIGGDR